KAMTLLSAVTSMSPIGLLVRGIALAAGFLVANWDKLPEWWDVLWQRIQGPVMAGGELFKTVLGWTPLGLIIENWEPIVGWFKGLWDRVAPFIEPILEWFGGDSPDVAVSSAAPPLSAALPAAEAAAGRTNLQ